MPAHYRIIAARNLVYVRYDGVATLAQAEMLQTRYVNDPDRRAGQRYLIDLSPITDWERDFLGLMKFQAATARELVVGQDAAMMMVFYVRPGPSMDLARHMTQTWEGVPETMVTFQTTQEGALSILGLNETSFDDLLATVE